MRLALHSDVSDEVVSQIVTRYYELNEFDRPQTEDEYRKFAYWMTRKVIAQQCGVQFTEQMDTLDRAVTGKNERDDKDDNIRWNQISWLKQVEMPDQERAVMVTQALDIASKYPGDLRRVAMKMMDGANIVEVSEECGMTMIEAMRAEKALVALARWLAEDDRNEKFKASGAATFSHHPHERAYERHGIRLQDADFVDMVRQIKEGRAVPGIIRDLHGMEYLVSVQGQMLRVVYDSAASAIVTVLPDLDSVQ